MSKPSFQIRVCQNPSCGLRYPLTLGHPFGERCPLCLGETLAVLERVIAREPIREDENSSENVNLHVLLDNIRSAWNVGSIFRTADGFGWKHLYLCGITPTPENEAVIKTSLGAEEYVTWSHHMNALKLVRGLKKAGWKVWALEDDKRAQPASRIGNPACKTVLILGSEATGVDPELLDLADEILYIPMRGQKRSFNVAIAFGVAAQIIRSQV